MSMRSIGDSSPRRVTMVRRILVGAATLISGAPRVGPLAQQAQPPERELAETFTEIAAVAELGAGRLLVVDRGERRVVVYDPSDGTMRDAARIGDGPRELRLPWTALALGGDSAAVYDAANRRLLVFGPDGRPGSFLSMPGASHPGGQLPMGVNGPAFIDAAGRFYWAGNRFDLRPGIPPNTLADSLPLLRQVPGMRRIDTLAWLRRPNLHAAGRLNTRNAADHDHIPWPMTDDWVVLPDGSLIVVRAPEQRIDIRLADGTPRRVMLTAMVAPLTEWQKSLWETLLCSRRRVAFRVSAEGALVEPRMTTVSRSACVPKDWPDAVPGFVAGQSVADPAGAIWVHRMPRSANELSVYDVIPLGDGVARTRSLPSGVRVIAVGRRGVYAMRVDEDDLQHLQVHPR